MDEGQCSVLVSSHDIWKENQRQTGKSLDNIATILLIKARLVMSRTTLKRNWINSLTSFLSLFNCLQLSKRKENTR